MPELPPEILDILSDLSSKELKAEFEKRPYLREDAKELLQKRRDEWESLRNQFEEEEKKAQGELDQWDREHRHPDRSFLWALICVVAFSAAPWWRVASAVWARQIWVANLSGALWVTLLAPAIVALTRFWRDPVRMLDKIREYIPRSVMLLMAKAPRGMTAFLMLLFAASIAGSGAIPVMLWERSRATAGLLRIAVTFAGGGGLNLLAYYATVSVWAITLIVLHLTLTWDYDARRDTERKPLESTLDSVQKRRRKELRDKVEKILNELVVSVPNFSPDLPQGIDVRFLCGAYDEKRAQDTEASREIEDLIQRLTLANIGVAGPRGAGKSTIIMKLCTSAGPSARIGAFGAWIQAPVKYEEKEFLLTLFERICQRVLEVHGVQLSPPAISKREALLRYLQNPLMLWPSYLLVIGSFGTRLWFSYHNTTQAIQALVLWAVTSVALLMIVGWITELSGREDQKSAVAAQAGKSSPWPDGGVGVALQAYDRLNEIQYTHRLSEGMALSQELPTRTKLEIRRGQETEPKAVTLPQLVQQYRTFLEKVLAPACGKVIVGIDELDKIENAEEARAFLRKIKSVFSIPRCYYLVSISEEAMETFQRRELTIRDEFDSTFDEIVAGGYAKYTFIRPMLISLVRGLPEPYILFCHALSGGLPRDAIRAARQIILQARDAVPGNGWQTFSERIGWTLHEDVNRKAPSFLRELGELAGPERAHELVALLGQVAAGCTSADASVPAIARMRKTVGGWIRSTTPGRVKPTPNGDSAEFRCLCYRVEAYCDFVGLLRRVFSDRPAKNEEYYLRLSKSVEIDEIASAQRLLSHDPLKSCASISQIERKLTLPTHALP